MPAGCSGGMVETFELLALLLSTFPIAVVTESAEGVVFALKVSAGDIVEKETLRWPLLVEEEFFDVWLLRRQPIEIGIEIMLVKAA
jgi:hypothetical protein